MSNLINVLKVKNWLLKSEYSKNVNSQLFDNAGFLKIKLTK